MDSKEIPKQGCGLNGKLNEVLSPAKAVSSGMGDLDLIENEILTVEAEASFLELKVKKTKKAAACSPAARYIQN